MKINENADIEIDVDQTARTEPPFKHFLNEVIIIVIFLVGIFTLFPTEPKATVNARQKSDPGASVPTAKIARNDMPLPNTSEADPSLDKERDHRSGGLNLVRLMQTDRAIMPKPWEREMTDDQARANQALIERIYDEVLTQGSLSSASDLFAQPFYYHELGWPKGLRSSETINRLVTRHQAEMIDVHYTIEELTVLDDLVIVRWTAKGIADGPFMGRQMHWWGTTVWRIKDGNKVSEAWTSWSLEMDSDPESLSLQTN